MRVTSSYAQRFVISPTRHAQDSPVLVVVDKLKTVACGNTRDCRKAFRRLSLLRDFVKNCVLTKSCFLLRMRGLLKTETALDGTALCRWAKSFKSGTATSWKRAFWTRCQLTGFCGGVCFMLRVPLRVLLKGSLQGSSEGSLRIPRPRQKSKPQDGLKQLYRSPEACRKSSQKLCPQKLCDRETLRKLCQ